MRVTEFFGIIVLGAALAAGLDARAEAPPVAAAAAAPAVPNTLWSFLGIPQGINKIRDATKNKRGNHPQRERKPPLKRIADPQNLQSQNPAIKAAAKIKTEEDLAPQKIKAIKYLATVGCGCYPAVREALLAALGDCTEEVRYRAAIALCQASGDPCQECDRTGCCNAEVMSKLEDLAHGQDEKGCFKEPSARVRAAAENALNACRRKIPPTPAPAEVPTKKKELPIQPVPIAPEPPSSVESPSGAKGATAFRPEEDPAPEGATSGEEGRIWADVHPASASRVVDVEDPAAPMPTDMVAMGRWPWRCPPRRCLRGYETIICPEEQPVPSGVKKAAPGEAAPAAPAEAAAPPPSALAGTYGAAAGPLSAAPNMIGDFFGGGLGGASFVRGFSFGNLMAQSAPGGNFFTVRPDGTRVALNATVADGIQFPVVDYNDATGKLGGPPLNSVPANGALVDGTSTLHRIWIPDTELPYEYFDTTFRVRYDVSLPSPSAGGVVGRTKIAENTSPIPRDRLLFNYSYFDGVPLLNGGVNVNRFTPGFEKTFFNGWMSLEMKIPMATTLDSTIVEGGMTNTSHGEFGNMVITYKTLVLRRETFALSGGLMVAVPTGDDTLLVLPDGTPLIAVRNRATHLGPFIGWLWTPNDRFFAQGFLQWDVGASGNPVLINDLQGGGLTFVSDIYDATFQYLDIGIGSWLYRSNAPYRRVTGVAWTTELHWNKSLQPADVITAGDFRVGNYWDNFDLFNLTVGAHLEMFDKTTVTVGYCCPLGGGQDREFNGEFRLMVNRRFGPQNRMVATPQF
jgi:hypothetical protein